MNISHGVRHTERVQNSTVKGIAFLARIIAANVNVDLSGQNTPLTTVIDLSKIKIKVTLERDNQRKTICDSDARILGMDSKLFDALFEYVMPAANQKDITLLAHGAAAKNQIVIPFAVDFGTVINVKNSDILTLDINVQNGTFGTAVDGTVSYIQAKVIEGIGLEFVTPKIEVYPVKAAEANMKVYLGNNVVSVSYINTVETGQLDADLVLTDVKLDTDRLSFAKDYYELAAERADLTEGGVTNSEYRGQSLQIHAGEVDDAKLELTFNSANVDSNVNFIVVRSFDGEAATYNNAVAKQRKHTAYDLGKLRR